MNPFLHGAIAMACSVAGLYFLHFWRLVRDRFFVFLALAFWVLAAHWSALGIGGIPEESRHHIYLLRLLAFTLILAGILDKNRR